MALDTIMKSKLEIRLISYFLLIAFAVMLIAVEFYFEMDHAYGQDLCLHASDHPLEHLRDKLLIMFVVLSIVIAIVLTMFIKIIASPLAKMATVAKQINDGDLSQSVTIESQDEIGEVGLAINDLASNLQELSAFTAHQTQEALDEIKHLQAIVSDDPKIQQTINQIEDSIQSIHGFVSTFTLLNTEIADANTDA